jgi:predicted transcriptional regulator
MNKNEPTTITIIIDQKTKQNLIDVATKRNRNRSDGRKWTLDDVIQEAIHGYLNRIEQMEAGIDPKK